MFKNHKISYIFDKTLFIFIICDKCGSNDEKIFEKESMEILENLGLIDNMDELNVTLNEYVITLKKKNG